MHRCNISGDKRCWDTWQGLAPLEGHGDAVGEVQDTGPAVASVREQEGGSVRPGALPPLLPLTGCW